mmetsp:Transcript_12621/g.20889  ORF Transcript_12621/g.20889 Transcript_12621/m.20889 type:complete len:330 (-) Transcript_12621:129-1118(-)
MVLARLGFFLLTRSSFGQRRNEKQNYDSIPENILSELLLAFNPASSHRGWLNSAFSAGRCKPAFNSFFSTPQSTESADSIARERTAATGLSPQEWTDATRQKASDYLATHGPHVGAASENSPKQEAPFLKQLWGVDSISGLPADAQDSSRVLATVYEIGGPLTNILSTSVNKKLPLIPHVGIRVHGIEYFYSDHIEFRTVPVMEEMLGERPQVTLDLGPSTKSAEEVKELVASLESSWTADDYNVFDKNCVHFSEVLAEQVSQNGLPAQLMRGVLDVSERMLDSLPDWRRNLGKRVMNEVTRLVVVSWGRASQKKKEDTAEKLKVEKGA